MGRDKPELFEEHRNKHNLQVRLRVISPLVMTGEALHLFFPDVCAQEPDCGHHCLISFAMQKCYESDKNGSMVWQGVLE